MLRATMVSHVTLNVAQACSVPHSQQGLAYPHLPHSFEDTPDCNRPRRLGHTKNEGL